MVFYQHLKQGFEVGYLFSLAFLTATLMYYYFFTCLHFITTKTKARFRPSEPRSPPHQDVQIEQWVARMRPKDIKKATQDFSPNNLIGIGKMGPTFKAVLPNGVSVAVKRVSILRSHKHLISELKCLGRLRHTNLVPLFGFCADYEQENVLLVYKHMPNGNLRDWLRTRKLKEESSTGANKDWSLKLRIGVGVARALAWLHHCSAFRLAHLNLTSWCVMLDYHFVPGLSNFGGAVFAEIPRSSRRRWETEYMKRDVYSFGILLFEIFMLKEWSRVAAAEQLREQVRSRGHCYRSDVLMALNVALKCVSPVADHRPNMDHVYKSLVEIQALEIYT